MITDHRITSCNSKAAISELRYAGTTTVSDMGTGHHVVSNSFDDLPSAAAALTAACVGPPVPAVTDARVAACVRRLTRRAYSDWNAAVTKHGVSNKANVTKSDADLQRLPCGTTLRTVCWVTGVALRGWLNKWKYESGRAAIVGSLGATVCWGVGPWCTCSNPSAVHGNTVTSQVPQRSNTLGISTPARGMVGAVVAMSLDGRAASSATPLLLLLVVAPSA
jgi:hypothetical protein